MVACSPALAFEADVRLDDEVGAGRRQALGQALPRLPLEDGAEVAHRHLVAVHLVGPGLRHLVGAQVRRDLVTEEVEVDPALRLAADAAAEQLDVETAGRRQIGDRKGEMEGRGRRGGLGHENGS